MFKGCVHGTHVLQSAIKEKARLAYQLLFKCRTVNAKKGNYNTMKEDEWCLLYERGEVREKKA